MRIDSRVSAAMNHIAVNASMALPRTLKPLVSMGKTMEADSCARMRLGYAIDRMLGVMRCQNQHRRTLVSLPDVGVSLYESYSAVAKQGSKG